MAGASCTEGVGCLRWLIWKELNGWGGFCIYCPFQFDINPFSVWFPACLPVLQTEDWQTQFFHGPITENKPISLYLHIFRGLETHLPPVESYVWICMCFFLPLVTVEHSAYVIRVSRKNRTNNPYTDGRGGGMITLCHR